MFAYRLSLPPKTLLELILASPMIVEELPKCRLAGWITGANCGCAR